MSHNKKKQDKNKKQDDSFEVKLPASPYRVKRKARPLVRPAAQILAALQFDTRKHNNNTKQRRQATNSSSKDLRVAKRRKRTAKAWAILKHDMPLNVSRPCVRSSSGSSGNDTDASGSPTPTHISIPCGAIIETKIFSKSLVIGRSSKCDARIKDLRISSRHCVIEQDQVTMRPYIRNESSNGIKLFRNNESTLLQIRDHRTALEHGDRLDLVWMEPTVCLTFELVEPRTAQSEYVIFLIGILFVN